MSSSQFFLLVILLTNIIKSYADTCSKGFLYDLYQDQCQACQSQDCSLCNNYQKFECQQCNNDKVMIINGQKTSCQQQCENFFFEYDGNKVCQDCNVVGCIQCLDKNNCKQCMEGYQNSNGKCIYQGCDLGQVNDSQINHQKCSYTCSQGGLSLYEQKSCQYLSECPNINLIGDYCPMIFDVTLKPIIDIIPYQQLYIIYTSKGHISFFNQSDLKPLSKINIFAKDYIGQLYNCQVFNDMLICIIRNQIIAIFLEKGISVQYMYTDTLNTYTLFDFRVLTNQVLLTIGGIIKIFDVSTLILQKVNYFSNISASIAAIHQLDVYIYQENSTKKIYLNDQLICAITFQAESFKRVNETNYFMYNKFNYVYITNLQLCSNIGTFQGIRSATFVTLMKNQYIIVTDYERLGNYKDMKGINVINLNNQGAISIIQIPMTANSISMIGNQLIFTLIHTVSEITVYDLDKQALDKPIIYQNLNFTQVLYIGDGKTLFHKINNNIGILDTNKQVIAESHCVQQIVLYNGLVNRYFRFDIFQNGNYFLSMVQFFNTRIFDNITNKHKYTLKSSSIYAIKDNISLGYLYLITNSKVDIFDYKKKSYLYQSPKQICVDSSLEQIELAFMYGQFLYFNCYDSTNLRIIQTDVNLNIITTNIITGSYYSQSEYTNNIIIYASWSTKIIHKLDMKTGQLFKSILTPTETEKVQDFVILDKVSQIVFAYSKSLVFYDYKTQQFVQNISFDNPKNNKIMIKYHNSLDLISISLNAYSYIFSTKLNDFILKEVLSNQFNTIRVQGNIIIRQNESGQIQLFNLNTLLTTDFYPEDTIIEIKVIGDYIYFSSLKNIFVVGLTERRIISQTPTKNSCLQFGNYMHESLTTCLQFSSMEYSETFQLPIYALYMVNQKSQIIKSQLSQNINILASSINNQAMTFFNSESLYQMNLNTLVIFFFQFIQQSKKILTLIEITKLFQYQLTEIEQQDFSNFYLLNNNKVIIKLNQMVIITLESQILYRLSSNNSIIDHINYNEDIDIIIVVYSLCETIVYQLSSGNQLTKINPSSIVGYCFTQFLFTQKSILILQPIQIVFVDFQGKQVNQITQERTSGQIIDLAYVIEDINTLFVSLFGSFLKLDSRTTLYLGIGIAKFVSQTSMAVYVDNSKQWSVNCSSTKKICFIFENKNMVQLYPNIDMKRTFYLQFQYFSELKIIFVFSTDSYLIMNYFDIPLCLEYDLKKNNIYISKVSYKEFIIDTEKDSLIIAINKDVLVFKLSTLTFVHHIHSSNQMVRSINLNFLTNQLLVISKSEIVYYDYDYFNLYSQNDHDYLQDLPHKTIILSPSDNEQYMVINYSQQYLVDIINLQNRNISYSQYIQDIQQAMYLLRIIKLNENEFVIKSGCHRYILIQYKQGQFITVSDIIFNISTCIDSKIISDIKILLILTTDKLHVIDLQASNEKLLIDLQTSYTNIISTHIQKNNLLINLDHKKVLIIQTSSLVLSKIEQISTQSIIQFYQSIAICVDYNQKLLIKYDINEQKGLVLNTQKDKYNSSYQPKNIYIQSNYFLIDSDDSLIYAYNIQNLQLIPNKLSKPSVKYTKIKFFEDNNLLILYSFNQINIYETIGLKLISKIRKINIINIKDVFIIDKGLLLIQSSFNVLLQSYSTNKSTTIQQFSLKFPQISYILKKELVPQQNQFILELKGSYESEILQIEFPINRLSLYQEIPDKMSCLKSIKSFSTGINLIETTKLIQDYIYSYQSSTNVKVLQVGIQKAQNLVLTDQIFQIISSSTQINVAGQQESSEIYLGQKSQISSQIQFLSIMNLKISQGQQISQTQFNFNKSLKLQQLNIQNSKIDSNCPILFNNMQVVNIEDLIISINEDSQQKIFLSIKNVTTVNILNLNIYSENNKLNITSSLLQIIDSNNVKIDNINIHGLIIDYSLISFILIENVNTLIIKNVKIFENTIKRCMIELNNVQNTSLLDINAFSNNKDVVNDYNLQKQVFLFVQGGQILDIQKLTYDTNKYLSLFTIQEQNIDNRTLKVKKTLFNGLQIKNTILSSSYLIYCQSQNIMITGSGFFENQSDLQLIELYGEQINLQKVTFELNVSNFCLLCVQSYTINLQHASTSVKDCDIYQNTSIQNSLLSFTGLDDLSAIKNNIYKNQINKSKIGGTFYISNVNNCHLEDNQIYDNIVTSGSGGGILIHQSAVVLVKNQIQRNQAEIGGGIRYMGEKTTIIFKDQSNLVKDNNATLYGNNICSFPQNIKVEYQNQQIASNQTQIQARSGIKLDETLKIQIIDEEGKPLQLKKQPISSEIVQEYLQYQVDIQSIDSMQIDGNLQVLEDHYNYQPTLTLKPMNHSQLIISLSSSILKYDFKKDSFSLTKISFSIPLEFIQCMQGEVPRKLGNGHIICYQCPEGSYSLYKYTKNSQEQNEQLECQKCPDGVKKCYQNQIQVANGYWRPSNISDDIVYCYNKETNCLQSDNQNSTVPISYERASCIKGAIGARCESCDSTGKVWGQKYGRTSIYNCTLCDNKFTKSLLLIGIIVVIVFYNFFAIHAVITQFKQKIIYEYLKKMGILFLSKTQQPKVSAMVIKIAINYFQIINILSDYRLNLSYIQVSITIFGDQSSLCLFSLDCELAKFEKVEIVFTRLYWMILQFLLVFFLLIAIYWVKSKKQKEKFDLEYIYLMFLVVCSLFQAGIIRNLSKTLSCTKIGKEYYMNSDMAFYCYGEQYYYQLYIFILPSLLIFTLIIPMILGYKLYINRHKLNHLHTLKVYGQMYQEYKKNNQYWDVFKITIKSIIFVISSILSENSYLKTIYIVIVLFFYMMMVVRNNPFSNKDINSLEIQTIGVLILSFLLAFLSQHVNESINQIIPILLLILINLLLIIKYCIMTMQYYLTKNSHVVQILSKFINKLPKLVCLKPFIQPNNVIKTGQYWQKVFKQIKIIQQEKREILREISQYKVNTQDDIIASKFQQVQFNILEKQFSTCRAKKMTCCNQYNLKQFFTFNSINFQNINQIVSPNAESKQSFNLSQTYEKHNDRIDETVTSIVKSNYLIFKKL